MLIPLSSFYILPLLFSYLFLANATSLAISIPANVRLLPPSTRAILTTKGAVQKAPLTRWNTFNLKNITHSASYLLTIACRDYEFERMRVDVDDGGRLTVWQGWYGGGEKIVEGLDVALEVRVLRNRDYYEDRPGFSLLSLLKNPMILIAIVGLAFVIGMPYLLDSMDPEMKAEFEEHQKKSILAGGGKTNPLQDFDMAAWMAGKTSVSSARPQAEDEGGAAPRARRRG